MPYDDACPVNVFPVTAGSDASALFAQRTAAQARQAAAAIRAAESA